MLSPRHKLAGPYKTLSAAQDALDDMFADGEVSYGEFPKIERREKCASWDRKERPYYITVNG